MEDEVLVKMLLEYGFMSEEQIEETIKKKKQSDEDRTLTQFLVQEGTLSVRALKTLHSAYERRREAELQEEALNRRSDSQKRRTQALIRKPPPPPKKTPPPKPRVISFGIKKKSETREVKEADFKPVTLMGLKEEIDSLREEVKELHEEINNLKGLLK